MQIKAILSRHSQVLSPVVAGLPRPEDSGQRNGRGGVAIPVAKPQGRVHSPDEISFSLFCGDAASLEEIPFP